MKYITILVKRGSKSKLDRFLANRSQIKGLSESNDGTVHVAVEDHLSGIRVFEVQNKYEEIESYMNMTVK